MSQRSLQGHQRLRLVAPMVGRDPGDDFRASTPLELFFDLVFVVAVSLAADRLHHGLAVGHVGRSIVDYGLVFFAIWWAWMNFTWFASAYDTDDVVFRLFVFVTMTGALVMAAGIPRAFDDRNYRIAVLGYVIMRIALVTQWIRAARADPPRRRTAYRYAVGITLCQIGWIIAGFISFDRWVLAFAVFATAELLVPVWAERAAPTTWHAEHIAERYGLFMIIVLGESVLAASIAIQSVLAGGGFTGELATIAGGGLLILFAIWWLYFDRPEEHLTTFRVVFLWGYGHYFLLASAAAVGAGLSLAIQAASEPVELGETGVGLSVAAPVVVLLLGLWVLHVRVSDRPLRRFGAPVIAALVLATTLTGIAVLLIGLLLVAYVAFKVVLRLREGREALT